MDRETALRKLRACWGLAKSSNPNEAATALRQAQALMAEHGFSIGDVDQDAIQDTEARTRSRGGDVARHLWLLASTVAAAFRCYTFQENDFDRTTIRFVGRASAPEIAAYSFDVLRRQLEAAVRKHVTRCRKRKSKAERGEAYGVGWVLAVRTLLNVQDLPPETKRQYLDHLASQGAKVETTSIAPKNYRAASMAQGLIDGRSAQLNPGLNGSAVRQLENASCAG